MNNERSNLLSTADTLVNHERQEDYGDPRGDFQRIADMWTTYIGKVKFEPHDVAAMMIMLKLSRISWDANKFDNWVDIAGYAACGWENVSVTT